jgi:hypothetical protein
MIGTIESLIEELERDPLLDKPDRLRQRIEALDHLEAWLVHGENTLPMEPRICQKARAICDRLEGVNARLYQTIRSEIQRGAGKNIFSQYLSEPGSDPEVVDWEGYDYLDELIGGVLQLQEPSTEAAQLEKEMVAYQPTPARHLFDLISRTGLTERDVLVDLGSGLGHVPLLTAICTDARSNGIELEPVDEVDLRGDGDDAALVAQFEQLADGLAAVGAVVEGAVVHIHADEAVGQAGVEVAGKLHGVFEGLFAVVEGVLDAVAHGLGDDAHGVGAERAADGVAAQRQHQAGGFAPPDAEVEHLVEAAGGVGELALVDDEAGVEVAGQNLGNDLVEGDGDGLEAGIEDLERQIGGGQGAGNGDLDAAQVGGCSGLLETIMGP